ncbi:MAG: LacI family DNA-binding transcriptional regulator [Bacillota bacterium]
MNIKDIAKLAGASVATVSRVLNNDESVAEKTRQKVLRVIEETGYKPNYVGRSLRKGHSRKLLVMLPTISNPFYSEIVVGFDQRASSENYGVLLAVTHRDPEIEKQYYELLFTRQVDGVASFIPTISHSEINEIAEKYPFVACCWRGGPDISASYVCIDNEKATYDTVKYLVELGHKKIAIMNGNYPERIYERERENGYLDALEYFKIPFREEYRVICDYDYKSAYENAGKLMSLKEPPTAILALSDERAAGVIKYLVENGYTPGVDVDVVGFDNTVISEVTIPDITTVAQPRFEIGQAAADLLIEQIKDKTRAYKGIIMAHKLIIRGSTRKTT